jgi:hypothetical protein
LDCENHVVAPHRRTLTITKGDARLDLLGHFGHELISESERERIYSLWVADQERLVGLTTDGKQVTLVDCTQGSGGAWASSSTAPGSARSACLRTRSRSPATTRRDSLDAMTARRAFFDQNLTNAQIRPILFSTWKTKDLHLQVFPVWS